MLRVIYAMRLSGASNWAPALYKRVPAEYRSAIANGLLAALFFSAVWLNWHQLGKSFADDLFMVGAVAIGILSLFRKPPSESEVTIASVIAYSGMFGIPFFMNGDTSSSKLADLSGVCLETVGVALSQLARLCMGRSFGIFPANRGIVTTGPFRWVRHPVYLGWLLVIYGRVLCHLSGLNVLVAVLTLPFVLLRISLEEKLLLRDERYRAYCAKVRFRLVPYLY